MRRAEARCYRAPVDRNAVHQTRAVDQQLVQEQCHCALDTAVCAAALVHIVFYRLPQATPHNGPDLLRLAADADDGDGHRLARAGCANIPHQRVNIAHLNKAGMRKSRSAHTQGKTEKKPRLPWPSVSTITWRMWFLPASGGARMDSRGAASSVPPFVSIFSHAWTFLSHQCACVRACVRARMRACVVCVCAFGHLSNKNRALSRPGDVDTRACVCSFGGGAYPCRHSSPPRRPTRH